MEESSPRSDVSSLIEEPEPVSSDKPPTAGDTIRIGKFRPECIPAGATILIVGRRSSGKSVLLADLMWHLRKKLDLAVCMNPTEEASQTMSQFAHDAFIFEEFSDPTLIDLLQLQRGLVKESEMTGKEVFLKIAFVMDDCMGKKKVMKTEQMRDLYMMGRHRRITTINCVQYLVDMPADLRNNVDFVFAFKEPSVTNREKLFKFFFGQFKNFADFEEVFSECTGENECMVINNRMKSTDPSRCMSYYKARWPMVPKFRFGKKIFWRIGDKILDRSQQRFDIAQVAEFGLNRHKSSTGPIKAKDEEKTESKKLRIEKIRSPVAPKRSSLLIDDFPSLV